MIRLTRKTALAIEAVLDVAYNGNPHPVQARDITGRQGIPHRYLEQILQQLVREGVLRGVRGPRGGYKLARESGRVTVGEVVRIVNAMDRDDEGGASAAPLGAQVVAPLWETMVAEILDRFDAITLEDLCREASRKGVPRADGTVPDMAV